MDNAQQATGVSENPTIPLQLPLQFVNLALVGLAKLPGEVCIPVIEDIKRQSYAHIATLREQAEAMQKDAAEAATADMASPADKAVRATPRPRSSRKKG